MRVRELLQTVSVLTLIAVCYGRLQCYSCKGTGNNELEANINCLESASLEYCDDFYEYYDKVENQDVLTYDNYDFEEEEEDEEETGDRDEETGESDEETGDSSNDSDSDNETGDVTKAASLTSPGRNSQSSPGLQRTTTEATAATSELPANVKDSKDTSVGNSPIRGVLLRRQLRDVGDTDANLSDAGGRERRSLSLKNIRTAQEAIHSDKKTTKSRPGDGDSDDSQLDSSDEMSPTASDAGPSDEEQAASVNETTPAADNGVHSGETTPSSRTGAKTTKAPGRGGSAHKDSAKVKDESSSGELVVKAKPSSSKTDQHMDDEQSNGDVKLVQRMTSAQKQEHSCYSSARQSEWEKYVVEKGCKKTTYCKQQQAADTEWSKAWNFCCDRVRCNAKLVLDKPQRIYGMGCRMTDDCIQGHTTRPICPHYYKNCPKASKNNVKMECRAKAVPVIGTGRTAVDRAHHVTGEKKCFCQAGYIPRGPVCTSNTAVSTLCGHCAAKSFVTLLTVAVAAVNFL